MLVLTTSCLIFPFKYVAKEMHVGCSSLSFVTNNTDTDNREYCINSECQNQTAMLACKCNCVKNVTCLETSFCNSNFQNVVGVAVGTYWRENWVLNRTNRRMKRGKEILRPVPVHNFYDHIHWKRLIR